MSERTASCSCGQLRIEVRAEPVRVSVCHCLACQQRTGSAFGEQARFTRQEARIIGEATEYVRVGDEGAAITYRFCPRCGATLYYTLAGHEDLLAIPVGAFADPSFPPPTTSNYDERMHRWLKGPAPGFSG